MKKSVLTLAAVILGMVTMVNANNPLSEVESAPNNFKSEITKNIEYPDFAQENSIEGEVWMKVTVDENSLVKIVDLSSTNPELGSFVQSELSNVTVEKSIIEAGNIYFMKVKFELIK